MGNIWKKEKSLKRLLLLLILPLALGCSDINKNSSSIKHSTSSLSSSSLQESSTSTNSSTSSNSSTITSSSSNISSSITIEDESVYTSTNEKNEIKYRIMLIAGHGQNDVGAVYQNRKEAEYNQNFVNQLTKELDKYNHQIEILLEPTPMKAAQEAELISKYTLDFVLSIHFNAGGGTGSEMIVPFYESDFTFAYNFFASLEENNFLIRETSVYSKSKTQRIKRAKKDKSYSYEDYFAVIRAGAKKKVPSYILEVEFIDNVIQMQKYDQRKDVYISLLAKHIVEYFD